MRTRFAFLPASVLAVALLGGCATVQRPDPLEPANRKVFAFNDAVDRAVLKPVAERYVAHVPPYLRTSLSNFFGNLRDVWSAANLFLQGRPKDGLDEVLRVSVNTVFGAAGLMDVASPMGLYPHREDLGQTLGHWGAGPGAYLVLPLLGPSSVRDVSDVPAGWYVQPQRFIDDGATRGVLTGLNVIGRRADALPATRMLEEMALDPYLFTRDAYLQRRQSLIERDRPLDEAADSYPAAPADDAPEAAPGAAPATPPGPQSRLAPQGAGEAAQWAAGGAGSSSAKAAWPAAGAPAPLLVPGPLGEVAAARPASGPPLPLGGCSTGRCLPVAAL
jgi:phospholipid-binding lipoprotein MlaA